MAKFLPFIVEKSTPINIFQTLISRSKGMNNLIVASIFYLVLAEGIIKIRKSASQFPEMTLDKVYEALIAQYPEYKISNKDFQKIQSLKMYVLEVHKGEESNIIPEDLKEYDIEDIMSFFLVMSYLNATKKYTTLDIDSLFDGEAELFEDKLLELKLFSNEGIPKFFKSKEELRAYIHFYSAVFYHPPEITPVKAVLDIAPKRTAETKEKADSQWDGELPPDSWET